MIKKHTVIGSTYPWYVRFLTGAFRACKISYDLYSVDLPLRHRYWCFLVYSHLNHKQIEIASELFCVIVPFHPEDDLNKYIIDYVAKNSENF